ncbi:MAG: HAMP domain-containing histidine kinase [Candidatus Omnitrophica bacterium]|nr:HAMP domain-containing histidine kinase [Candidatus Omnitrophota bacterium]
MTNISVRTILLLTASVIVVAILTIELDWMIKLLAILVLLGSMTYVTLALDARQGQVKELSQLRTTCEQLDQQAKRIIRSDLELHRTQEALDRKVASLLALHALSQRFSLGHGPRDPRRGIPSEGEGRVNLHPEDLYGQLTPSLVSSFGFSKGLSGVCQSTGRVSWKTLVGVSEHEAQQIEEYLHTSGLISQALANPMPRAVTPDQTNPSAATLLALFQSRCVVLAGIKPSAGPSGCLLLAREDAGLSSEEGDQDLVGILADQLAIAIESSALYEEAWNARQGLERTVQERTRELEAANAQLTRLNKAKSDFVSAVSHELRTPLSAVKGYASLLSTGQFGSLQPAQKERLSKIEKHADLLTDLINNLLDIARIESGRVTMESRPITVKDLLAHLAELFKPQADAKHLTLSMDADGVDQLLGDPKHLPRVLINLLSNAVKYTPEGGAIRLSMSRHNGQIVTSVKDTGAGIDPSEVPKLFQEFYRAAHPINEQVKGTGLGLTLVKRIIEAHQGTIQLQSEIGKGTTVTFTLPEHPSTTPQKVG